jgi:hypothetical protein
VRALKPVTDAAAVSISLQVKDIIINAKMQDEMRQVPGQGKPAVETWHNRSSPCSPRSSVQRIFCRTTFTSYKTLPPAHKYGINKRFLKLSPAGSVSGRRMEKERLPDRMTKVKVTALTQESMLRDIAKCLKSISKFTLTSEEQGVQFKLIFVGTAR